MKTLSKLLLAAILTAPWAISSSQAQISLVQADSIAKAYLRTNWLPQWEDALPFLLWLYTPSADIYPESKNPDEENSFVYFAQCNSTSAPHFILLVNKESGQADSSNAVAYPWADLRAWRLSDLCWGTDPIRNLSYQEANLILADSLDARYSSSYPNPFTVYAYPDTSTLAASWSFEEEGIPASSSYGMFSEAPATNVFFYFFIEEKNDSLWTSLMSIEQEPDSSIRLFQSEPKFNQTPLDLWTYPAIYTHLRQVSNEAFPETASAAQAGKLFPNVPNPFSSVTRILYSLPESCRSAELKILDLQGRLVQRLALDRNGNDEAEISLDGHASGLYIGILLVDGIPTDRLRLLKTE